MLDATKSGIPIIDNGYRPGQDNPGADKISFRTSLPKVRQRRRMMMVLTLVGAAVGMLAGLAYVAIRVPAFSASSELLISNTTLQLSGPEAVVTQVLLENSLIESAMALLKSGRVLERVIDKLGVEEVERISVKRYALPGSSAAPKTEADRRQAAISLLRSNTTVGRVGASQILTVRARAVSAIDAAMLTNEIAGALVKDQYEANAIVTTNAALRERIKVLGPTVRVISDAVPPSSKDPPSGMIAMLLAIVGGGAVGVAGALAFILLDPRLRAATQLAAATSVQCFGYVPLTRRFETGSASASPPNQLASGSEAASHSRRLSPSRLEAARRYQRNPLSKQDAAQRSNVVTASRDWLHHAILAYSAWLLRTMRDVQQWSLAAEPNRDLESVLSRAVLRRVRLAVGERSRSDPHIIGITSCRAGEGKTTIAANLARFIAQEGAPVLLIDASSSEVAQDRARKRKPGLQELLRGTCKADKVVQRDVYPSLDFLPYGTDLGDLDLMWSDLLHAVSGVRERHYRWIILDLPELTTEVDVRAAGQVFDELLVVVEWGRTTREQLKQRLGALGSLRERIIGTIINKVPWASVDSGTAGAVRPTPSSDHRREMNGSEATS
jgi:Mrp family chromosome partitioning ATPase/capsular polysaccharide biosynthesis protein